ncbi:hypothetical protein [Nafulsella turpanensis]|uniref:hypothetical protein n=1 Tax=Nafulsella turpanensis TaxID=1265690 RepID=UPI000345B4BA|nr:hypothetical protein [Nafulsella turpanensis]
MSPSPPLISAKALNYLHDKDFLLTKRKTIRQLQQWLSETQQALLTVANKHKNELPPHALQRSAKISRGENYHGLPYLVLDYPRLLSKEDVFSFRTFFWWGNYFSCTLHLQGHSLRTFRPTLIESLPASSLPDDFASVNDTPWEYHFQPDNYRPLSSFKSNELEELLDKDFFKISRKLPLEEYQQLPSFARNCFQQYLRLLKIEA